MDKFDLAMRDMPLVAVLRAHAGGGQPVGGQKARP